MSRSICLQFSLLVLYLLLIFIISRLHDLVLWFHNGFSSTEVVDPLLLSVRQLKHLLEVRGVSYTGCVEKHELASLVEASGDVTQGEVVENSMEIATRGNERLSEYAAKTPSYFTGGPHFYEEVEDTKDSVWLVQVVPSPENKIGFQQSAEPLLDDYSWRVVCNQLAPFAIRTGIFDCRLDRRLCMNKGWHRPLLLLALPRGWRAKDKVVVRTSTCTRPQAVIEWVREQLAIRLNSVKSLEEAEDEWLRQPHEEMNGMEVRLRGQNSTDSYKEEGKKEGSSDGSLWSGSGEEVRVLLVTHLLHPPLFLAALSIKFTGRIRFGVLVVRKEDRETVKKRLGLNRVPAYLVSTPEHTVVYGSRPREHFSVGSMNAFLRTINPETNDAFLLSLALTNALVFLQAFQVSGRPWRHAASCIWALVSHNLWLFTIWLVVLGTSHFPLASMLVSRLKAPARWVAMSDVGSLIRSDWMALLDRPFLLFASLAAYAAVAAVVLLRLKRHQITDVDGSNSDANAEDESSADNSRSTVGERAWWEVFPMDSYLLDCFFRPVSSATPSVSSPSFGSGDLELEEGMEMLMERLEMPDLWLRPTIPLDYIKDLPTWRYGCNYRGEGNLRPSKPSCRSTPNAEDEDDSLIILDIMDADNQERMCREGWCRRRIRTYPNRECNRRIEGDAAVFHVEVGASRYACGCNNRVADSGGSAGEGCNLCTRGLYPAFSSSSDGEESGGEVGCNNGPPLGVLHTTECAVCLDSYSHGTVICGLPCGHNYHRRCIMTWLHGDNHDCPVCRWPAYRSRPPRHVSKVQTRAE